MAAAVRTRRAVPLAAVLLGATAAVGVFSPVATIERRPLLLGLLVGCVVALDLLRVDVFGRASLSAATVPALALAFAFGPLGAIAGEAAVALSRLARRSAATWTGLDLGLLGLSGSAAAATWRALDPHAAGVVLGVGALGGLAFFAANTILASGAMVLARGGTRPIRAWRELFAWLAPHHVAFGALAGAFILAERRLGLIALVLFALPTASAWLAQGQYLRRSRRGVTELRRSHAELEEANARLRELLGEREALLDRMHRAELSTIASLARTIEAKDPYTGGHGERVARMALRLAAELEFAEEELRAVEVGALVHDIGKIGVRDEILLKPGALSDTEYAEMRKHPVISSYIIGELELPPLVRHMARSHHERWAGGGYPDGLAGEQIPLAARVLAVADALDAMTSDRPYRPGRSFESARAEVVEQSGRHFCPRVVRALQRSVGRDPGFWHAFSGRGEPAPALPRFARSPAVTAMAAALGGAV